MAVVGLVGGLRQTSIQLPTYLQWFKFAFQFDVHTVSRGGSRTTVIAAETGQSTSAEFFLAGNPYGLGPREHLEFVPGTPISAGSGTTISGFSFGLDGVPVWQVSGLRPVKASDFLAILTDQSLDSSYRDFVALFDSNDRFRGGDSDDRFEPGGGNDRVNGGAGGDIVFKWRPGNISFDGGAGHDILSFAADQANDQFPSTAVEALRIDLAAGTGRSPWGGRVTLSSVEELRDTDGRDVILGSRRGDTVASDHGGGDLFNLRGGNDTVRIFERAENLTYVGGPGRDELILSLGFGDNTLDLRNPGANAGVFAGARITEVEVFSISSIWSGSTFRFFGANGAERVGFAAGTFSGTPFARAEVVLGGGNDRALGGAGNDAISGGGGRDVIDGGPGNDTLAGGAARDQFHFTVGFGRDRITDFDAADLLDFRDHDGVDRLRDLVIRQVGDDVRVGDGAGGLVTLVDVDRGEIGTDQILI